MVRHNSSSVDLAATVHRKLKSAKIKLLPGQEVLEDLFECLFFTSLKTEEGQFIKVTITYINPENPDPSPPERMVADRWNFIPFEEAIPLNTENLIKLSQAADPWSSSLAVFHNKENELFIWGMIDQAVHYQSFLNYEVEFGAEQPGVFQASITDIANILVIFEYHLIGNLIGNTLVTSYIDIFKKGAIYELLMQNSVKLQKDVTNYFRKEFADNGRDDYWNTIIERIIKESLSRLLLKIQNYHHGGAFLITSKSKGDLNIKYKINYPRLRKCILKISKRTISDTYYSDKIHEEFLDKNLDSIPTELYLDENVSDFEKDESRDEFKGIIRFVASLSCVDGLIVISPEFNIVGFGAIIQTKEVPDKVYVSKTSMVKETELNSFEISHFGTRHRSIFAYCWKHFRSIGFIVSQDGDIRAVTRVNDKLIMWENIKVNQYLISEKLKKDRISKSK